MRTTVTLDPDVDRLLKEEMRRSGTSFREALNRAVRRGLANSVATQRKAFKLRPRRLSLRLGIDPAMVQHFDEDLEIESFLQKTRKLRKPVAQSTPRTPTSNVSQAESGLIRSPEPKPEDSLHMRFGVRS